MTIIRSFSDSNRFLSNFVACPVMLDGEEYRSVEHAYQAAKTLDHDERKIFRRVDITSGKAKRIGKNLNIREDWDEVKDEIMFGLLQQKFAPGTEFAELLLETGDAIILEGNSWGDQYWGVDINTLEGENRLGELLMNIRDELLSCNSD